MRLRIIHVVEFFSYPFLLLSVNPLNGDLSVPLQLILRLFVHLSDYE